LTERSELFNSNFVCLDLAILPRNTSGSFSPTYSEDAEMRL